MKRTKIVARMLKDTYHHRQKKLKQGKRIFIGRNLSPFEVPACFQYLKLVECAFRPLSKTVYSNVF